MLRPGELHPPEEGSTPRFDAQVSPNAGGLLRLESGVLAGRTERQSIEQAKEAGTMALVGAPDEWEVVAAGMGQVGLAGLEQLVPTWRNQRVHGCEALVDGAVFLVRQEQVVQGSDQPVRALDGRRAVALEGCLSRRVNVLHTADEHLAEIVQGACGLGGQ
jgi:hypothetical protein